MRIRFQWIYEESGGKENAFLSRAAAEENYSSFVSFFNWRCVKLTINHKSRNNMIKKCEHLLMRSIRESIVLLSNADRPRKKIYLIHSSRVENSNTKIAWADFFHVISFRIFSQSVHLLPFYYTELIQVTTQSTRILSTVFHCNRYRLGAMYNCVEKTNDTKLRHLKNPWNNSNRDLRINCQAEKRPRFGGRRVQIEDWIGDGIKFTWHINVNCVGETGWSRNEKYM